MILRAEVLTSSSQPRSYSPLDLKGRSFTTHGIIELSGTIPKPRTRQKERFVSAHGFECSAYKDMTDWSNDFGPVVRQSIVVGEHVEHNSLHSKEERMGKLGLKPHCPL